MQHGQMKYGGFIMKKVIALCLVIVMCLSPVAYGAAVQEEQTVETASEYQKLHLEEKAGAWLCLVGVLVGNADLQRWRKRLFFDGWRWQALL